MKRLSFLLVLLSSCIIAFPQDREIDSLRSELAKQETDTGKILLSYYLSNAYQASKPDSALLIAQEAYYMAKNKKFIQGESWALNQMAVAFNSLGNFPKALEYYIEQLKMEEKLGVAENIAIVQLDIALLYNNAKDHDNALVYAKKADSIFNAHKLESYSLYSLLDIGDIYEKKNNIDSALYYTKKCLELSIKAKNKIITGTALNNLGNIYYKSGDDSDAFNSYKEGLPYLGEANDYSNYAEGLLGLARIFEKRQQPDSAIYYGKKSYDIAHNNQFLVKALDASVFLTELYKKKKITDSAFIYQEVMISLRDSIDSREKIKDVQNITTEEELRQKELAQLRLEEIKERKEKLQLLLIGIIIPIFFIVTIVISRKKVHIKLIELLGIISILLFFEYITLLLHPFIAEKTNHSPFIEIIVFVAIAAVITPSHHRIERWLIDNLKRYNYLKLHPKEVQPKENVSEEEVTD